MSNAPAVSERLRRLIGQVAADVPNIVQLLCATASSAPMDVLAALLHDPEEARREIGSAALPVVLDALLLGGDGDLLKDSDGSIHGLNLAEVFMSDLSGDAAVAVANTALRVGHVSTADRIASTTLSRFPNHAGLLRLAAERAYRQHRVADAHEYLNRIARADSSYATVQTVYRQRKSFGHARPPDTKIALLSSFTVEPLAAYVDLAARDLGLEPEIYIAPFNSIGTDILSRESGLYGFVPDIIFLSAAIDDLIPDLGRSSRAADVSVTGETALSELLGLTKELMHRSDAVLVLHNFVSSYIGSSVLDWDADGRGSWLRTLNQKLAQGVQSLERVHLLDIQNLLLCRAGGRYDNPKMRYMAAMRLGEGGLSDLARAYARYLVALKGLTRKCIVVDLDNTLWGGIVGEDGPEGIQLGPTSPGIEYVDFQQALLALTKRGILLAINSKNNPDDALEIIRRHEYMQLREHMFGAVRINWKSKVENMESIADELNIGLHSMVFMDDSPTECEQMRQLLPEVLTVELPRDPSLFRATLESLPNFDQFRLTAEDKSRTKQYRARRSRNAARQQARSVEQYLKSLDIRIAICRAARETLPRVVQLINKTNQFNLTTHRYSAPQVQAMLAARDWRVYALRARDRFGNHGIVAVALVEQGDRTWRIDTFLMSCRVIGYGIEIALLARLKEDALSAGATVLRGEYCPSAKNSQVADFYERHRFAQTQVGSGGHKVLELELPAVHLKIPEWITVEEWSPPQKI